MTLKHGHVKMSNIVKLDDYRNKGNGAREALMKIVLKPPEVNAAEAIEIVDTLLANLWYEGFKVVPLTPEDESAA
jgi:hypothetical protein